MDQSRLLQLRPYIDNARRDRRAVWAVVYHLMRADLYERTRRYSFLITLGFVIFVAYLYLPPRDATYLTLGLGNYRGIYNSAWIGGAMAILCSTLLSLPAFYLVKDAVERDRRTRVGQILATTPLSRPLYTLGKAFGNFVFLTVAVGVIACAGIGMQMIRGEEYSIDLWALLSPFVFSVLPAMAMIAALAVLFETISWLRGTFGNVVYFFLWLGMLIATAAVLPLDPHRVGTPVNDLWGVSVIASAMVKDTAAAFPNYSSGFSVGVVLLTGPLQIFAWKGISWTVDIVFERLLWFGAAVGVSLVAALFFRRFDPSPEKTKSTQEQTRNGLDEHDREPVVPSTTTPTLAQLSPPVSHLHSEFASLLLAELRLTFKGRRWWWYFIALSMILAGLLVPPDIARQLLLVVWLWPLPLWSALGTRETRHRTGQLVFTTPHVVLRQMPTLWLSGVVVGLVVGGGVAVTLARAGDWMHLVAWGTAVAFIPALALALGAWSRSNKLFEVVYMVMWYMGPVNRVPALDFMGIGEQVSFGLLQSCWVGTLILLVLAVLGRQRQVRMT